MRAARKPGIDRGRWLLGLAAGTFAGACAVGFARPLIEAFGSREATLLGCAVLFLGPSLLTWRALERLGWSARIA